MVRELTAASGLELRAPVAAQSRGTVRSRWNRRITIVSICDRKTFNGTRVEGLLLKAVVLKEGCV